MPSLGKNAFFKLLGAPLHNPQWSWGAHRDDLMVLQVWSDRCVLRGDGRKWAPILRSPEQYVSGDRLGFAERYRHALALWQGAIAGYAIVAMAADPDAMPRVTSGFRDDAVFVIEQIEMNDGQLFGLLGPLVNVKNLRAHRQSHRTVSPGGSFPINWGPMVKPQPATPASSRNTTPPDPSKPSRNVPSATNGEFAERESRFALTETRPAQQAFRLAVFRACGGRCVVSGCDVPEALEAAHLHGRNWKEGHNGAQDGVLLRRDLHALYDRKLLSLADDGSFVFSEKIGDHYASLIGAAGSF